MGRRPPGLGWAPRVPLTVSTVERCYCAVDRWGNRPGAQWPVAGSTARMAGQGLEATIDTGPLPRVPGPQAKHPSSLGVCSQKAPLLSSGKCAPKGWAGHTNRLDRSWGAGQAPVGLLPDHFEHADMEGPVEQTGARQLVNPELGGCDRLPGRDLGQVEAELLPVGLLVAQGAVELHCKTRRGWRSALAPGSGSGVAGPSGSPGPRKPGQGGLFPPWEQA